MDALVFDQLTRTFSHLLSRRRLAGGLGLVVLGASGVAEGKKRKRKKKRKLKKNPFGCVDVGGKCLGNGANCCSGICEGKRPKKGKKDKSVCVAHDTAGICFQDTDSCATGVDVSCGFDSINCLCLVTTGNAGFCGDVSSPDGPEEICRDCDKDIDCQDEFGPGAACVFLAGVCTAVCAATGRTACLRPCPAQAP